MVDKTVKLRDSISMDGSSIAAGGNDHSCGEDEMGVSITIGGDGSHEVVFRLNDDLHGQERQLYLEMGNLGIRQLKSMFTEASEELPSKVDVSGLSGLPGDAGP